jgi:TorA maturation chaperone TorD
VFDEAELRRSPVELIRGLAVLAEPPTEEHARIARALDLPAPPTPPDYSDLFLFQLYPYASVHLGPEGMMGGEARSRVAGFWRALGYDPPGEPDHLASLLGLYAALAEAEARGRAGGAVEGGAAQARGGAESRAGAEGRLLRESRMALLHEHLAPWVFSYLTRVRELTDGVYGAWAGLLERTLRADLDPGRDPRARSDLPPLQDRSRLPLHLRTAPPLPDPREEGAEAFVTGLLAPVRAGLILTRADLARIAAACELGLRAGERRYALEHLLAQEPERVVRALAAEATRQGALHEDRIPWLGTTARFHAERAGSTARLLEALADEEAARELETTEVTAP